MERCCVCRGKAEVCSLFENWGEGIYNVYAFMSVLYSRKKKKMLFCSVVLRFTGFPILHLLLKGKHCGFFPKGQKKFPLDFFLFVCFVFKDKSNQAEKTSSRYKCFEELCMLAWQCSGAAALGLFEPRRAHRGGSTSSVGIWHPAATEPTCSMIPPRAEPALDC